MPIRFFLILVCSLWFVNPPDAHAQSSLSAEVQKKIRTTVYDNCYQKVKSLANKHQVTFQTAGYCECSTKNVTLSDAEMAAAIRGEIAHSVYEKYDTQAKACLNKYR